MKTTLLRSSFIICGILAVFAAGFLFGGGYASSKANREAYAVSLIYFTSIHDAMDEQKYDHAALVTNNAVDKIAGLLHASNFHPLVVPAYASPLMPDSRFIPIAITEARRSYSAHPDELQSETRDILAIAR